MDGHIAYMIAPEGAQTILRNRSMEDAALKVAAALAAYELAKKAGEQTRPDSSQKDIKKDTDRQLTEEEKLRYRRAPLYEHTRGEVWERSKSPYGNVYDDKGRIMKQDEPWDAGHKEEFKREDASKDAAERGISRKQWIEEQNNPNLYQAQRPRFNQTHEAEGPTGSYQPAMPSQPGPHVEDHEPVKKKK